MAGLAYRCLKGPQTKVLSLRVLTSLDFEVVLKSARRQRLTQ